MSSDTHVCPSREQLELLTDQRLAPADQAAIQTHIGGCTVCQSTLAGLRVGPIQDCQPTAPEPEPEGAAGRKVPGEFRGHARYRVTGVLGRGGMGTVYKAEHRLLERPVVLKVIRPDLLDNPSIVQRFQREARLAARLSGVQSPVVRSSLDMSHSVSASPSSVETLLERIHGVVPS